MKFDQVRVTCVVFTAPRNSLNLKETHQFNENKFNFPELVTLLCRKGAMCKPGFPFFSASLRDALPGSGDR